MTKIDLYGKSQCFKSTALIEKGIFKNIGLLLASGILKIPTIIPTIINIPTIIPTIIIISKRL